MVENCATEEDFPRVNDIDGRFCDVHLTPLLCLI
jgi:hypothetical protein